MKKIILAVVLVLLSTPFNIHAKTFAYLFAKDEIIKIDTETDVIAARMKSANGVYGFKDLKGAVCAVDLVNKYWITGSLSASGRDRQNGLYVYDLTTLKQIKFVSFPAVVKEPENLKIIYPQKNTKFYLTVEDGSLNNAEGGTVNLTFDKKTFNYIGTANNLLNDLVDENFWFSEDQNTIYVESAEGNIRVYDSQTLQLVNTLALSNIYAKNVWGKGIDDIKNGVILLGENNKLQDTDKNNISFITYNIATASASPRVVTGMVYEDSFLTPDGKKVVFSEEQEISTSGTKAPKKGGTVTGRIYVYDVQAGKKLGLVTLPTDFSGKILGIRPQSDKLYYLKYSRDESNIRLYVVDLVRLRVAKEITVPNLYFMVFFEE